MKKVLILGANGMAGHMIATYLKETNHYRIVTLCHKTKFEDESILCDVYDLPDFKRKLIQIEPDIIVNAIGILNDKSEIQPLNTYYINTILPKWLEHYYRATTCKIIHLSTDCVFSGKRGDYLDFDDKDEESTYGLSKNFGELDNEKDLTLRMSIIGPELKAGKGLFDWFMRQTKEVKGYSNVYWTGITTLELAHIIDLAIQKNAHGLYHVVPDSCISKYDLLLSIKQIFHKKISIKKDEKVHCNKTLIPSSPSFIEPIKDYNEMLIDLKNWMNLHKETYHHYKKEYRFKRKFVYHK